MQPDTYVYQPHYVVASLLKTEKEDGAVQLVLEAVIETLLWLQKNFIPAIGKLDTKEVYVFLNW